MLVPQHQSRERRGAQAMTVRRWLREWRLPLGVAALLALLQAADLRSALEYQRDAVLHGQVWRLLTASLVHLGWVHLVRDLAGLCLIWGLFSHWLDERTWLWLMTGCALGVGVGLLAFAPGVIWYVGISGVLFGMFCAGALCEYRSRPLYASALLLGMAAIIVWALVAGALPGETIGLGGKVVPQAHLFGALAGGLILLLRAVLRTGLARQGDR
jgi:rhomboid family GlyGly-CTERM serine protease